MRRGGVLLMVAMTTGCLVPYTDTSVDTDTDVDVDDSDTDTDTDVPDDTPDDTWDTGLDPNTTDTSSSSYPPLDCHPWDPFSYSGWVRRYAVSYGANLGDNGIEIHEPTGSTDVPPVVAGQVSTGVGYEVRTRQTTSANSDYEYWGVCTNHQGDQGAYDIGYNLEVGTSTLKAGARIPHKYLPTDSEMQRAFISPWTVDMRYNLRLPVTGFAAQLCPYYEGNRHVEATYAPFGTEMIDIPALGGTVEAYKINLILDQTQTLSPPPLAIGCVFSEIFGQAFDELFGSLGLNSGDASDGGFVTATIDRWYVRGVGLVKEEARDFTSGENLWAKTLSSCEGLPNCP